MKKLIIVESPTKAKTITKFLKSDAIVMASMGHIREIPENGMNVDLNTFVPKYTISNDKKEIVRKMRAAIEDSDELYLATDEDREGESISYHIADILRPKIPTKRMVFHEITKSAILKSLENTRDIDMNMVNAQEARRVLDRLFGFEVSPILWKNLGSNHLSAGRVQSPTLRLVVDREYKRLSFVSSKYNIIKGIFSYNKSQFEMALHAINGKLVARHKDFFDSNTGKLLDEQSILLDDEYSKSIIDDIKACKYKITDVHKKETKIYPPPPFITSTLQQEANSTFHFSARETMKIAQELYERGLITYMRTDSPSLSKDGAFASRRTIESLLGSDSLSDGIRVFKSKDDLAQEAHEAIRPAIIEGVFKSSAQLGLTGKSAQLYELIYRKTLACQMKDNIRLSTTIVAENTGENIYSFMAKGSVDIQLGFKQIYKIAEPDGNQILPNIQSGEGVLLDELEVVESNTHPPKRWTEASLIKEIERLGIGRPSTYATIVSALIARGYVIEVQTTLIPTFLGFIIIKFLENHLSKFIDYDFTSNMEEGLDDIEKKKINKFDFLNNFYRGTDGLVKAIGFNIDNKKEELRIELPNIDKDKYKVYFGKYGTYFIYNDATYPIPSNVLPYQLTNEKILEIMTSQDSGEKKSVEVGLNPKTGEVIEFYPTGKYGAYFSMKHNDKINFVSLPKGSKAEEWSIDELVKLFSMPLSIGKDDRGNNVFVANGKYGPYISYMNKNIPYKNLHKLLSMDVDEAISIVNNSNIVAKKIKKNR